MLRLIVYQNESNFTSFSLMFMSLHIKRVDVILIFSSWCGVKRRGVMHLQLHNLLHVDGDGLDVGVLLQLGLHQSEVSIAAASDQ